MTPTPGLSRHNLLVVVGFSPPNSPKLLAFEPGYPCGNKLNGTFPESNSRLTLKALKP